MVFSDIPGLSRLKAGLSKTRNAVSQLLGRAVIDDDWFEALESSLIESDAGARKSAQLVSQLRASLAANPLPSASPEETQSALRARLLHLIEASLSPLASPVVVDGPRPRVVLVVGVNGAGKTTTLGKLAHQFQAQGQRVVLAAGDTFRAAAREQLAVWGERNGVALIAQPGADPAAVAFDAVQAGLARGADVVLVDTAGRLPAQLHLMEELKKVKRVLAKAMPDAPHEVWLVVDGGTGQNALHQVKAFDDALGLTGLVVTKLDGTARGGILLALAQERPIPVRFVGVGEQVEDLQAFDPKRLAEALI